MDIIRCCIIISCLMSVMSKAGIFLGHFHVSHQASKKPEFAREARFMCRIINMPGATKRLAKNDRIWPALAS